MNRNSSLRDYFISECGRITFTREVGRLFFEAEGFPAPSNGILDACTAAAITAGIALPLTANDRTILKTLCVAYEAEIQKQIETYRVQA